jgi:hypothetical protein
LILSKDLPPDVATSAIQYLFFSILCWFYLVWIWNKRYHSFIFCGTLWFWKNSLQNSSTLCNFSINWKSSLFSIIKVIYQFLLRASFHKPMFMSIFKVRLLTIPNTHFTAGWYFQPWHVCLTTILFGDILFYCISYYKLLFSLSYLNFILSLYIKYHVLF